MIVLSLGILIAAAVAVRVLAQEGPEGPPPQDGGGPGGPDGGPGGPPGGPGRPGGGFHLVPPFAVQRLALTADQQEKIAQLEKDTRTKLEKILTPAQKKLLEQAGPPPFGQGGPGGPRGGWRGPGGGPGGPGGPGNGPAGGSFAASKLKIADPAPQWTSIVGTDDKPHSLADSKDAKAVVVVFTCNHCPVATAYQERLIALQKDYKDKGVQVIAICVNKGEADDLDALKKRAISAGFNFPYLYDPTQQVGRDYGATCTPHAFVLNKDRKVAYMGAIDDNMRADKVEKHYIRAVLDSLLSGKTPETPVTRQVGCSIQYE